MTLTEELIKSTCQEAGFDEDIFIGLLKSSNLIGKRINEIRPIFDNDELYNKYRRSNQARMRNVNEIKCYHCPNGGTVIKIKKQNGEINMMYISFYGGDNDN